MCEKNKKRQQKCVSFFFENKRKRRDIQFSGLLEMVKHWTFSCKCNIPKQDLSLEKKILRQKSEIYQQS